MSRISIKSMSSVGFMAVLLGLLIWSGAVYQVGAAPPQPAKRPTYTPEPLAGKRVVIEEGNRTWTRPPALTPNFKPQALILSESFEGTWPAPGWDIDDLSAIDGGEYFWSKRNCHPHTGNFGGWSVGGGAGGSLLGCLDNYPNNVFSWAVYGPFDLSQAVTATLTYHYWGTTEGQTGCPFDYLAVSSSIDGQQFSAGNIYCGDWTSGPAGNGYYQGTLKLDNRLGQSQVWVAFIFKTDIIITHGGITIDDINLNVTNSPFPPPNPLTATPLSENQMMLSWGDNSINEAGFKIERSQNDKTWSQVAKIEANITTYTDTDLSCDTTYLYRVRAYKGGSHSNYSDIADGTTSTCKIYLPLLLKPVQPPDPTKPRPGFWESNTGEEFYVTPGSTQADDFAIFVSVSGCGNIKITRTTPVSINKKQFAFSGSFYASGTFNSATTASGTSGLSQFFIPGCGFISGGPWSWNATWQNSSQPALLTAEVVGPEIIEVVTTTTPIYSVTPLK